MPEASVIVSFYNNVAALKCIIRSLEAQSKNIELIIADDGSKPESIAEVNTSCSHAQISIQCVSQLDIGFRKNRALNKAIASATSDYLIFIDGDCIPQSFFIDDHLTNKQRGYVLNGRRADIPTRLKKPLFESPHPEQFFSQNFWKIQCLYFLGQGKNIEKGLRLSNDFLVKKLNRKKKGLLGCNFSIYKDDLLAVNGFDNRYEVAGTGEDTDIEYRLTENGIKIRNLFYRATMLHPLHPELPRCPSADVIFQETKKMKQIIAKDGYHQAFDKD